jgi:hypothetical protein
MDDPWLEVQHVLRSRPNGYNTPLLLLVVRTSSSLQVIAQCDFRSIESRERPDPSSKGLGLIGLHRGPHATLLVPKLSRDAPHPAVGADM